MQSCCGIDPVWVENVRDKGYWFCKECRKEVMGDDFIQMQLQELKQAYSSYDSFFNVYGHVATCNPAHVQNVVRVCPSYIPQDQVDAAVLDLKITFGVYGSDAEDLRLFNSKVFNYKHYPVFLEDDGHIFNWEDQYE